MEWRRYTVDDKPFTLTSLVSFFLLIGGLYRESYLLFFIGVLYFVALFVNNYYLKHVGEELKVANKKVRNRHFIGEIGEWEIVLTNEGLPIMKGELHIVFHLSQENYPIIYQIIQFICHFQLVEGKVKRLPFPIGQ